MLRRQEQNAADPAALAAAKYVPASDQAKMEAEACFYAQQNGFFKGDPNCFTALNITRDLDVNSPPATTLAGQFQGHFGYVEVIINATHPSFFGQFLGQPVASVRTGAVAALTTGNANSSSLVALGDSCSGPNAGDSVVSGHGTVTIHAAAGVTTPGGFVNINAPCGAILNSHLCDANAGGALKISGGGTFKVPHAFTVGGCSTNGGGQLTCQLTSPCLDEQAIPLGDPLAGLPEPWPTITLPVPLCPKMSETNSPSDDKPCSVTKQICPKVSGVETCTMLPGVYYAGWDIGGGVKVILKPGMYVFAGYGIKMNAGSSMESATGVDGSGNLVDARVTIFSTDYTAGCRARPNGDFCQGPIQISSNGSIRLKATDKVTCAQVTPAICPWTGILLWQDGTVVGNAGPQDVTINGGSDLILSGTIYGPKSFVKINGSNSSTGCTGTPQYCLAIQLIVRRWEIAGGANVDMPYNPADLYILEQRGLVH
jgi:hypothetical protein